MALPVGVAWMQSTFFSIDVEASGPVPQLYSMLSIGICVIDAGAENTFSPGAELYLELVPAFDGVDNEALAVCGLSLDHLKETGTESKEAMRQLRTFVRSHTRKGTKSVFVGHNAPFDWMMVNFYFHWAGVKNPFGYNALDTKSLGMGLFGLPWSDCNKRVLAPLLGVRDEDMTVKHRADADARYQAEVFCAMLTRMGNVGGSAEQAQK